MKKVNSKMIFRKLIFLTFIQLKKRNLDFKITLKIILKLKSHLKRIKNNKLKLLALLKLNLLKNKNYCNLDKS